MADLAQLSIVVDSTSVKGAATDLDRLTTSAAGAETATAQLAGQAEELGAATEAASSGGMASILVELAELAGPVGLAAGVVLGKLAMNIFEMDSAAKEAAANEKKRHDSLLADLEQEIQTLREKRRLLSDPNGDSSKVQDTRADLEGKLTQALREQAAAQQSLNIAQESATGTDRASFTALANARAGYDAASKAVADLRTQLGGLESLNASAKYQEHAAQVTEFVSALQHQADQAGKTKAEILRLKEEQLQLTGADKAAADAAIAVIEANEKQAKAHKELIPLKERLIESLEKEVGAYGVIKSEVIAYQLAQENLTKSDKERIQVLLDQSKATQGQVAAQKELDDAFKNGDRIAKERDDLENKLLMTHEAYLASLRKSADPAAFADLNLAKELDGLDELVKRGTLSVQQHDKAVIQVKDDYVRLKAQGSDTWGLIVNTADAATNTMTEAFTRFVTGSKVGFSQLISSMLADLARMEAQKGFQQLFGYLLSSFAPSAAGGGSSNLVSGGYGGGTTDYSSGFGSSGASSGSFGFAAPASSASTGAAITQRNEISVTINKDGSGGQTEAQGDQKSQDTANKIHSAVRQVLIEELRTGGVLNARA